jgi:alpha-D-ribose 1-methylphosphonate 5-triphosphate synthase subunit PhnH
MNGDMDIYRLASGFDDPELGSQQTFRAIVNALDNPGHPVQIKSKLSFPGVLNPASAAIFLTLCNEKTTVWTDLSWNFLLVEWFQYQCGCNIVIEPCMADLALITNPITMPPLVNFRIYDEELSDTSTMLIIQVDELSLNAAMPPFGSVVDKTAAPSLLEVSVNFWDDWDQQSKLFSPGVDIFLTCDDIITALPQSIGQDIQNH